MSKGSYSRVSRQRSRLYWIFLDSSSGPIKTHGGTLSVLGPPSEQLLSPRDASPLDPVSPAPGSFFSFLAHNKIFLSAEVFFFLFALNATFFICSTTISVLGSSGSRCQKMCFSLTCLSFK